MTNTEIIALAAVVVTGLGLVINFLAQMASAQAQSRFQGRVQKQLEELKEEFAVAREHRQYTIPDRLSHLKQIDEWLAEGHRIIQDLRVLHYSQYSDIRQDEAYKKHQERLLKDIASWRAKFGYCYSVAILYNDLGGTASFLSYVNNLFREHPWSEILIRPKDRPLVLTTALEEILSFISEFPDLQSRKREWLDDQSDFINTLYLETTKLVEQIRQRIVTNAGVSKE